MTQRKWWILVQPIESVLHGDAYYDSKFMLTVTMIRREARAERDDREGMFSGSCWDILETLHPGARQVFGQAGSGHNGGEMSWISVERAAEQIIKQQHNKSSDPE